MQHTSATAKENGASVLDVPNPQRIPAIVGAMSISARTPGGVIGGNRFLGQLLFFGNLDRFAHLR